MCSCNDIYVLFTFNFALDLKLGFSQDHKRQMFATIFHLRVPLPTRHICYITTELRHWIRVFSWDDVDDVYGLFTFNFNLELILTFSQGHTFLNIILLTGTTLYLAHLMELNIYIDHVKNVKNVCQGHKRLRRFQHYAIDIYHFNTKFLGIYIDENLDWSKHIQQCKCKIASGNYAINVTKNVISPAHSKTLYYSLVYPYLNYGILLWGNTYKKYLHKLEISQKKPIRIINRAMYNEPSSQLFKKCNILKLQDIYKLQCYKLMYEFLKNNLPTPIMNIFTVNSDIHGHNNE